MGLSGPSGRIAAALLLALLLLLPAAAARSLHLTGSSAGGPSFSVALLEQRTELGRLSFGARLAADPAAAIQLQTTTGFGPLGNVTIDAAAAASLRGRFSASAAGRGSLGPLALRLRLSALKGDLPPLLSSAADSVFPQLPAAGDTLTWGVQLGATYRLSREVLAVTDPQLLLSGRDRLLLLPLELQFPRLIAGHDLRLAVETAVPLGAGTHAHWSAAAAGLRINRQRAAAWELWLHYGGTAYGHSPGLSFTVQESFSAGTLQAELRLEPYRTDLAELALQLSWSGTAADTSYRIVFDLAAPTERLSLSASLTVPVD